MQEKLLVLFLLAHAAIWTLIPIIFHPNIPLDVSEIFSWGEEWQLGYYKHPPFIAWVYELSASLFGRSASTYFFLSQICIIGGFLFIWKLALEFLSEKQALLAVVIMEGVYYYNYTSTEFNHNIILLLVWPWMIYSFWHALNSNKLLHWVLFGIAAAVGVLSKYYTLVLLLSMFLMVIYHKPFREASFKKIGAYIAFVLFAFMLTPHFIWLIHNDFVTVDYLLGRSDVDSSLLNHFKYPIKFFIAQIFSILAALILFFISFGNKKIKKDLDLNKVIFILFMILAPFALTLLFSFITGSRLRSMWGSPLWSMLGVSLFYFFSNEISQKNIKKFLIGIFIIASISVTAYISSFNLVLNKRAHFDGRLFAENITKIWESHFPDRPLNVIAGDYWLAGNVSFYSESNPSVFTDLDKKKSPWISIENTKKDNTILLWVDINQINEYKNNMKSEGFIFKDQGVLHSPWRGKWQNEQYEDKKYNIYWALIGG